MTAPEQVHILAVSSGGGHWIQMMSVQRAFDGLPIAYASTAGSRSDRIGGAAFYPVTDANMRTPYKLWRCYRELSAIVTRTRPKVIFSTGAAPGALAVFIGWRRGIPTMFLDSIANAERPSVSARLVRRIATKTLSQWPDVARAHGMDHGGAVL